MGLVLVPSEVTQMIKELREMLTGVMDGFKRALRAIIIFSDEERLKSDTWDTFKEKVVDYHDAIVRGMILVEDSLLADALTVEQCIGTEELDEDKLDEDIKKLEIEKQGYESELEALKQIGNSPIGALVGKAFVNTAIGILKDNIYAIEAEIRILGAKKIRLYSIENNTRNLFGSARRLLAAVKYAINDAGVEITGEGEMSKVDWRTTISDAYEKADSFRIDLRLQGFPEEYVECLMELHKKYPEWKFEAVVTGIDYQEFVDYQEKEKKKCVDIYDNEISKYSTGKDYAGERDPKYHEVNREGIIQFSNPCNIIQVDYENIMQFLNAEQELPQEYVNLVVPKILKNKDQEIVKYIINSDTCINPVFMACIWNCENGPNGEEVEYKGEKVQVYNFFNVGGDQGWDDSILYACEQKWYTPEECIKGSEETFQKYIDNGQTTLYALDWDYQSYTNTGVAAIQYATLLNDADHKADPLFYSGEKSDELMQNFVFKIPVYENIPPCDEEEFKSLKIPLIE